MSNIWISLMVQKSGEHQALKWVYPIIIHHFISHKTNVWYIYQHVFGFCGTCRQICHKFILCYIFVSQDPNSLVVSRMGISWTISMQGFEHTRACRQRITNKCNANTLPKKNIAPENRPSQKERILFRCFQPTILTGYFSSLEGI